MLLMEAWFWCILCSSRILRVNLSPASSHRHAPTCGELESPLEITLGEFYLMNCGTVGVPEFHLDSLSVDFCLVAKAHPKARTSFCHTI